MSDNTTQAFLGRGDTDMDLEADNRRFAAAQSEDESEGFTEKAKSFGMEMAGGANRFADFLMNAPKNIGVGAYRALVSTVDTASDLAGAAVEGVVNAPTEQLQRAAKVKGDAQGEAKAQEMMVDIPSLSEAFPDFMKSVYAIADEQSEGNRMEDDILQGVTQFTLPFLGYLKAFGGIDKASKVAAVAKVAGAEAITAGSAFTPHEGRFADLVRMGQQMENRFGDVLRKVAPDGSLANRYIDWMTNREGEGKWEGRFKNSVDSLATTAAIAGVVKAAGKTYRSASRKVEKKAQRELGEQGG